MKYTYFSNVFYKTQFELYRPFIWGAWKWAGSRIRGAADGALQLVYWMFGRLFTHLNNDILCKLENCCKNSQNNHLFPRDPHPTPPTPQLSGKELQYIMWALFHWKGTYFRSKLVKLWMWWICKGNVENINLSLYSKVVPLICTDV